MDIEKHLLDETLADLKKDFKSEEEAISWEIPIPLVPQNLQRLPYPTQLLPEIVKNAVEEYQAYGQQPISMIACSALANMSLACQGLANVARDEKLISPLSLYFIVIAESGERKTASDNTFSIGTRNWEQLKRDEMLNGVKESKASIDAWQAQRNGLLRKIENNAGK